MYMCIVWDKDTIVVVLLLYITTIDCRSNNQHVLEVHRPIAKLDSNVFTVFYYEVNR